ncbi:hypothetical protein C4573_03605 [Candidatus Woesearchaeota archaeon]|nr:MAG: hypothetical protein C4573_03605 [Candidatus Woesearchaeota archaeon]
MNVLMDNISIFYSQNVRLIKSLMKREFPEEYPEVFKWKVQMLYFDGKAWIEICRIDNYLHQQQAGSHIHEYKKEQVAWVPLTFQEAEKLIKEKSMKILKEKFNQIRYLR